MSEQENIPPEAEQPPTPAQPNLNYGPSWLYDDDEAVVSAREQLLGDYNVWVQVAGGSKQKALDIFIEDYPNGPMKAGRDLQLQAYLKSKFPWFFLYRVFEYRTAIFNTVTFIAMVGILYYVGVVYQPKPKVVPPVLDQTAQPEKK
jgi:hypothetical protein